MSDDTVSMPQVEPEYTLDELSKLANVTPRTVRYYIVEGLLPPPITTGRNATYSQDHLDRLTAITALKDMFLPLREIRHRLDTLTPEQMRDPTFLASISQAAKMERANDRGRWRHGPGRHGPDDPDSAAEYLDRLERRGQGDPRREWRERSFEVPSRSAPPEPGSRSWERIPLGDDAELLIRTAKVQRMGPQLFRMLHRMRHMIETEGREDERTRS